VLEVDSNSASAISLTSNATVTAVRIDVVGKVSMGNNTTISPKPNTGVAHFADPLAALPVPPAAVFQGAVNLTSGKTITINPGVYSQINVTSGKIIMNPGVYIIAGGGFTVTTSGSASGSGVMIYNAGSNFPAAGGSFGGLTFNTSGTINLSPPTTGTYTGMVIFQARDNTRALSISGTGSMTLSGTIYAPVALLSLGTGATLQDAIVVGTMSMTGNSTSTLTADGENSFSATAGQLLAGNLVIYADNSNGLLTVDEMARIQDAVAGLDNLLVPYSVTVTLVDAADSASANIILNTDYTSPAGTAADGVLGSEDGTGHITLLQGWNWYAGADPSAIAADQYDFQTVITHELGHALGLGHSADSNSVMHGTLDIGVAHRQMVVADLNIPDLDTGGPHGLHAAQPELGLAQVTTPAVHAMPAPPLDPGGFSEIVSVGPLAAFWTARSLTLPAFQPAALYRDQLFCLGDQGWMPNDSSRIGGTPSPVPADSTGSGSSVRWQAELLNGAWLLDEDSSTDNAMASRNREQAYPVNYPRGSISLDDKSVGPGPEFNNRAAKELIDVLLSRGVGIAGPVAGRICSLESSMPQSVGSATAAASDFVALTLAASSAGWLSDMVFSELAQEEEDRRRA
jgi:hypothetical protein